MNYTSQMDDPKNDKPVAPPIQQQLESEDPREYSDDYIRCYKVPEPGTYSEDLRWDRLNLDSREETTLDLFIQARKKREEIERRKKSNKK